MLLSGSRVSEIKYTMYQFGGYGRRSSASPRRRGNIHGIEIGRHSERRRNDADESTRGISPSPSEYGSREFLSLGEYIAWCHCRLIRLTAYDLADRDESDTRRPREQQALLHRGLQNILVEAGGIGAAVSEESMRRLQYCLHWLQVSGVVIYFRTPLIIFY